MLLILAICDTKTCCCTRIFTAIAKNFYNSKKKKITAHNVYVFIYGNEMLFKVGFVLANCFSMTVLRISFSFLFKDCDSQSDTADFLCCTPSWVRLFSSYCVAETEWLDSVIQTLLFHIAINSNSSFTTNCMIENGSTFICEFSVGHFCVFCALFKNLMNSWPLLLCALHLWIGEGKVLSLGFYSF